MARTTDLLPDELEALNDPRRIAARDAWMQKLDGLFSGRPVDGVFDLNGYWAVASTLMLDDHRRWLAEALRDLASNADIIMDPAVFRPLVVSGAMYGVHFVDAILGADVFDLTGAGNWQVRPLNTPVGELRPPDIENDPTWRKAREAALAFVDCGAALPFYETPTLSSPLNIALNLYGGELLVAMLADPAAARRDLRIITDLIVTLHRWYLDHVPAAQLQPVLSVERCQPAGYGQICGCSTQLLSPAQYADFIAPLDDEILSVYPNGGMIHLCGAHTQHVEAFRQMASLRAVQINDRAADDVATYFDQLRDDQVLYVNLRPGTWQTVRDITGGRRLVTIGPRE